jgi:hypothetical protein
VWPYQWIIVANASALQCRHDDHDDNPATAPTTPPRRPRRQPGHRTDNAATTTTTRAPPTITPQHDPALYVLKRG